MAKIQVDEAGNLANWAVPRKPLLGVGGAMDLATGAKKIVVTMTHMDRDGRSKLVRQCSLPLTAKAVVDVVITELAVFHVLMGAGHRKLALVKFMPGVAVEEVRSRTAADFEVALQTAKLG